MVDPVLVLLPVGAVVVGLLVHFGGRWLETARRRRYVASLRPRAVPDPVRR